ncbi:MAG: BREX-3 system phosphatase PglZ [Syntrophomonadaceae bacterium]|nr:BREX-3 system phosphatase PglZ [Syntrophomonadaceae bacterium]
MNWRDLILQNLQPGVSRLTLAADPDGLLLEEDVLSTLGEMGFDVLTFGDSITFRYVYEANYRSRWERCEAAHLVVVVQGGPQELRRLPFDVWQRGHKLFFSLADIFPKLSYPVVAAVEKSDIDKLYRAYQNYNGPALGEKATKDFILKHVFGVMPDLINSPVELMKILLSRHCNFVTVPPILDEHLIHCSREKSVFKNWPLEDIIPSREAFFAFLQEKWRRFLESTARGENFTEVPFDHYDIRVYIDTLFLEGNLRPVPVASTEGMPEWVRAGVLFDKQAEERCRIKWLLEKIRQDLPGETASYRDWQRLAVLWAELIVLSGELNHDVKTKSKPQIEELHDELEERFASWMFVRYGSLANLSYTSKPVMVHHIPRYLTHLRAKEAAKNIALLVIDGLALDQWLVIRNFLRDRCPAWRFEENQVFAWVPTLTSISRQALFAAEAPLYFKDSLTTTSKEGQHWYKFWENSGVRSGSICYRRGLADEPASEIGELLDSQFEIVGLVIDKVDRIMHGMELGTAGMHQQIRLWAEQGYLVQLIDYLLKNKFAVYLTSDHGNIAARGKGRLPDGGLAETRGERARIYHSDIFRQQMMEEIENVICWPGFGLPQGYSVLLARGQSAFVLEGEEIVSHGGISLEEVVVPFVRIWEEH